MPSSDSSSEFDVVVIGRGQGQLGRAGCTRRLLPGPVVHLLPSRGGLRRVTEATARQRGFDVAVQKYPLGGNSRTRIIGDTEGLVKIVTERQADGRTAPHAVGVFR